MPTKAEILKKLKTVDDPELQVNIVDLGLIYDISINNGDVRILMTLTSPGCPLGFVFDDLVSDAVKQIKGVKSVKMELTFDPAWEPSRMSEEVKLQLGVS